ncbi:MAG: c-type cytochrome [Taibaiella sp.]|nr:c-type cytochrome [Taibaiella sp.]
MRFQLVTAAVIVAISCCSCKEKASITLPAELALQKAPSGFPEIPFPEENPFSYRKWELGKMLFNDKMLSVDYTVSCASCHKTELGFSDNVAKSLGAGSLTGRRNSPTLTNVAYQPYFTREGGVPTLEMQILVPIQEHDEMNFNIVDIAERMKHVPQYVDMSREIFDREPDPYVITRAIATYERTLVSGNSAYDKYMNRGDTRGFDEAAQRGMRLFFSMRTGCSDCHSGFNFTNYSFENNGLYIEYNDPGRKRLTGKESDKALFKVPTLRNIGLTAPYMFDGSVKTLEDVVAHYNSGGKPHPNKSVKLRPLQLSMQEQKDLVAFLYTLTDAEFITNKNFSNE